MRQAPRGRPFQPGQSGNPGGRPVIVGKLRELARADALGAIAELARLAKDAKSETARIAAIKELLDRAYDKPTQFVAAEDDEPALTKRARCCVLSHRLKILRAIWTCPSQSSEHSEGRPLTAPGDSFASYFMSTKLGAPMLLSPDDFYSVVRLAPLVSIDLIIRNARGEVLLGLRNNEPAKGFYFVPGGIILKQERLHEAFARILKRETKYDAWLEDARLLGVYEHFYDANSFGDENFGTHYVVLAHELKLVDASALKSDAQHSKMRWWDERDLLASDRVHENTKAYFR